MTKEVCHSRAIAAFQDTGINVTCVGRPCLGAALGTLAYIDQFMSEKVDQWCDDLQLLSAIATTQPHAAFAAFGHGLSSKWSYISQTLPHISHLFQPLENIIRMVFIPSLTGQLHPSDSDRDLFALPVRLGGLGLRNPMKCSCLEFSASRQICEPLMKLIVAQQHDYSYECLNDQLEARSNIQQQRCQQASQAADTLNSTLPTLSRRSMDFASEKGGSNWLTSLPIEEHGFCLHEGAFKDTLALRYR